MSNVKKRILIVDDDENIHNLIKSFLGNHKYELFHAMTLEEGIEHSRSQKPNIILLDIKIGKDSGFDALEKLKLDVGSYIIMMSADTFNENIKRAIALGASDFLVKPLVNKVLIQKVKKAFLKSDNELHHVVLSEDDRKKWQCRIDVKNTALDQNTVCLLSESISQLRETIRLNNQSYRRLGLPRKLKNGQTKTIVTMLEDAVNAQDEYSNSRTFDQEDVLSKSGTKIFALDDDQNFLNIVNVFCTKHNIQVQMFDKIKTFQEALKENVPDLCLIDLTIDKPNDSFELIEDIRSQYDNLPILAVTADTKGKSSAHAVEIGANDFIYKPIKKNLFVHKILSLVHDEKLSLLYQQMPLGQAPIEVNIIGLKVEVDRVDEIGIHFQLMTQLKLGGNIILKPEEAHDDIILKITQCNHNVEGDNYHCYGEFQNLESKEIFSLIDGY